MIKHVVGWISLIVALPLWVMATHGDELDAVLARDLVSISHGRYIHEQSNRCRVKTPGGGSAPVKVSRRIEAPANLMSRDQFVSISTQLFLRNRIALATLMHPDIDPIAAVTAVECRRTDDQTEAVDFRIEISMTESGIEVATTDETSNRHASDRIAWAELLDLESD